MHSDSTAPKLKNKSGALKQNGKVNSINTKKLINRLGYLTREVEIQNKIAKIMKWL